MKKEKKEIPILFNGFLDKYSLEGDINEVSDKIRAIPERLKESYPLNEELKSAHRFSISTSTEYEYYSNDSHDVYNIEAYRWETDEEYNKRIEQEEKRKVSAQKAAITKKEATIKREKTLLNTLLKKYKDVDIKTK